MQRSLNLHCNPAPHCWNARTPPSFASSRHEKLLFGKFTLRTFVRLLRAVYGLILTSTPNTQRPSPMLLPEIQRKKQPNPPLEDLFFARKSCRFYVPKMHLKNANGCSVCAWLLTSGGLRLTLRLTPQRHPLASLAGADQAHTQNLTDRLKPPIPTRSPPTRPLSAAENLHPDTAQPNDDERRRAALTRLRLSAFRLVHHFYYSFYRAEQVRLARALFLWIIPPFPLRLFQAFFKM